MRPEDDRALYRYSFEAGASSEVWFFVPTCRQAGLGCTAPRPARAFAVSLATRCDTQLADDACWTGYGKVHDADECEGSSSAECTSSACTQTPSLWGLSVNTPTPAQYASHAGEMCEYFPGDESHEWEPDCGATSAFLAAAVTGVAGAPCEDGFQAIINDMATACATVDSAWHTVRCVATEAASEAEASACSAERAPTSAASCTTLTNCEYLDPSTLPPVWEGWGCAEGVVEETVCPVGCQDKIDHYCKMNISQDNWLCCWHAGPVPCCYCTPLRWLLCVKVTRSARCTDHVCQSTTMWEEMKPENKRLIELIGCNDAKASGQVHVALLAAMIASTLASWLQ